MPVKRTVPLAVLLLAGPGCAPVAPGPPSTPSAVPLAVPERIATDTATRRVVGYFASWTPGAKGVRASALDGRRLTEVIYAFANLSPAGEVVLGDPCADVGWCDEASRAEGALGGNFADLARLKAEHRHLRTLIAIGGWTWSERFSDAALTERSRRRFASSAVDLFIRRWPGLFDGIDVDWEYPVAGGRPENVVRPEDRENYTLLLRELRGELDEQGARDGRRYLLTVAGPAGPSTMANFDLEGMHPLLDWVNLMAYDFNAGSSITRFNAPLRAAPGDPNPRFNVESAVSGYLARGVPAGKIMLGVPFYGRGFGGVPAGNDGLFQPVGESERGEWGVGSIDFRRLWETDPAARGFHRYHSAEAGVPWLFNPATGVWISYDDAESLERKARFARERGLGGIMIWELGGDDGSLLPAIHRGLGGR